MNFLQISFGDQIVDRMEFVESVLRCVRPEDSYVLISDDNLVQHVGMKWIPADEYELELRKDSAFDEMWPDHSDDPLLSYIARADLMRVHYLSQHPDTVYLDTDVRLHEPGTGEVSRELNGKRYRLSNVWQLWEVARHIEKPCLGESPYGGLDDGLIYNGEHLQVFHHWLEYMSGRQDTKPLKYYGWYYRYLRYLGTMQNAIRVTGFFDHCYDEEADENKRHLAAKTR